MTQQQNPCFTYGANGIPRLGIGNNFTSPSLCVTSNPQSSRPTFATSFQPRSRSQFIVSENESGCKRTTIAILWFGAGALRLGDCGAVNAVASLPQARTRVLPIAVLTVNEVGLCARAVHDLDIQLRRLGSRLVVRIVQQAAQKPMTVAYLARAARAQVVYADAAVATFARPTISIDLRILPTVLSSPPTSFPLPPSVAAQSVQIPTIGDFSADGEIRALTRLRALALSGTSPYSALRRLSRELDAGSLAQIRVSSECRVRASAPLRYASASGAGVLGIVGAYDVLGNDRRGVEWDEETQRFRLKEWDHETSVREMPLRERIDEFVRRRREFLFKAFFPPDVTPDYYSFTAWRFTQRIMSATVGVFGTQALLLALGVKAGRIGQAAAISWVLKDGLGRVGKMIWASGMGKDFDVDPKRWRFRSALLYATGNGLEIVTQLVPGSFLLFATAANTLKQVSMLTSSACRNAMYRSFGDKAQNIANITAKGEAQIVVADLIGMVAGITLSKAVGTSKKSVLTAYLVLTALDIFGIYMELRQVVFRTLNPERSTMIIEKYLQDGQILTPSRVSERERIFIRPRYKGRTRFSSIAKAAKSPEELALLLKIYRRDHFIVSLPPRNGPCRVVLRRDASNDDVLRALLTAGNAIKAVRARKTKLGPADSEAGAILTAAKKSAHRNYPSFKRAVAEAGWDTEQLLFGTLKRRGYWRRE